MTPAQTDRCRKALRTQGLTKQAAMAVIMAAGDLCLQALDYARQAVAFLWGGNGKSMVGVKDALDVVLGNPGGTNGFGRDRQLAALEALRLPYPSSGDTWEGLLSILKGAHRAIMMGWQAVMPPAEERFLVAVAKAEELLQAPDRRLSPEALLRQELRKQGLEGISQCGCPYIAEVATDEGQDVTFFLICKEHAVIAADALFRIWHNRADVWQHDKHVVADRNNHIDLACEMLRW